MAYRDSDLRGGRILPKRSAVPNEAPSTGSLRPGELAANTADGILYVGKNNGTVSQTSGGVSGEFFVRDGDDINNLVVVQDGRIVSWEAI
jgi:hypothetical protein